MRIIYFLPFTLFALFSPTAFSQSDSKLPEGIMATRGDGVVTRQMFDAQVAMIPAIDRKGVLRSAERVKKILADLLIKSQLATAAKAAGFDQGQIQARMQLMADTELANAWLDHYVESQPDADYTEMAHEYYLLHLKEFATQPSRDVTHLLVSTKERSEDEAKQLAQSLLDQVKSDPAIFDQLVLDHSEDPSAASNKGHFKNVKPGEMVKAFEESAFKLQHPGDFSGLVTTEFGIHIIRLDRIHPVRTRRFEEVRKQLELAQKEKHKERVRYAYLNQLGTMKAAISEDEIRAMVHRYFNPDEIEEHSKKPESE